MPKVNLTVKDAKQVWQSDDKKLTIFKLEAEWNGQSVDAKTYSKEIATPGWVGEVEVYEKQGRYGREQFVRQPKKEGYQSGGYNRSGSKPQADPYTMFLSYAKDLAVVCVTESKTGKRSFDDELFGELLGAVSAGGEQLYGSRPGADQPKSDTKSEDTDEEVDVKQAIDKAFGDSETLEEDDPWKKQTKLPS